MQRERQILERAVRSLCEQAEAASVLVDEARAAGLGGSDPLTVHAKELRLELLRTKGALERELGTLLLNCSKCGLDVYWIAGHGEQPGTGGHAEPAPHGRPKV